MILSEDRPYAHLSQVPHIALCGAGEVDQMTVEASTSTLALTEAMICPRCAGLMLASQKDAHAAFLASVIRTSDRFRADAMRYRAMIAKARKALRDDEDKGASIFQAYRALDTRARR